MALPSDESACVVNSKRNVRNSRRDSKSECSFIWLCSFMQIIRMDGMPFLDENAPRCAANFSFWLT